MQDAAAPAPAPSPFGSGLARTSPFGTNNMFGNAAAAQQPPAFGGLGGAAAGGFGGKFGTTQAPAAASGFEAAAAPARALFGVQQQQQASSPFAVGGSAAAPSTTAAFGSAAAPATLQFGFGAATGKAGASAFGSTSTLGLSAGGSLFGARPAASSPQQQQQQQPTAAWGSAGPAASPFGTAAGTLGGTSLFGKPSALLTVGVASTPAFGFGGAGRGSPQQPAAASAFGRGSAFRSGRQQDAASPEPPAAAAAAAPATAVSLSSAAAAGRNSRIMGMSAEDRANMQAALAGAPSFGGDSSSSSSSTPRGRQQQQQHQQMFLGGARGGGRSSSNGSGGGSSRGGGGGSAGAPDLHEMRASSGKVNLEDAEIAQGLAYGIASEEYVAEKAKYLGNPNSFKLLERPTPDRINPATGAPWQLAEMLVREYRRNAAGSEQPITDIRPPAWLRASMRFLEDHCMRVRWEPGVAAAQQDPRCLQAQKHRNWKDAEVVQQVEMSVCEAIYDRIRQVFNEYTAQGYSPFVRRLDSVADLHVLEHSYRWHTAMLHRMDVNPLYAHGMKGLIVERHSNMTTLQEMYTVARDRAVQFGGSTTAAAYLSPNEGEFAAYDLVLNCREASNDPEKLPQRLQELKARRPEVWASPWLKLALQVVKAVLTKNYARFFAVFRKTPYVFRVTMLEVFQYMRRTALEALQGCVLDYSLKDLTALLCFADEGEALQYCFAYNLLYCRAKGKIVFSVPRTKSEGGIEMISLLSHPEDAKAPKDETAHELMLRMQRLQVVRKNTTAAIGIAWTAYGSAIEENQVSYCCYSC
jgi:SAC3/GANP family